jgi:predicted  nucleic acid-binding Zn-ribbon protein
VFKLRFVIEIQIMEQNVFEQLQQENDELQRALVTVERHLQTAIAEKEQVSALYNDFKVHYEQMRNQSTQYQKRLGEEVQARKELEQSLEARLNDMRRAIEHKQREIDQMANKMTLPIDTDIMRMKI